LACINGSRPNLCWFNFTLLETLERTVGMVSGLHGVTYDEKLVELDITTLKERRHQADMLQVFKILAGKDNVKSEPRFQMASNGVVRLRKAAGV
jgi:hypothetical protein